jgi:hypothetical protein
MRGMQGENLESFLINTTTYEALFNQKVPCQYKTLISSKKVKVGVLEGIHKPLLLYPAMTSLFPL